jgi:nucleoside-diphosphate-sugar epimerase
VSDKILVTGGSGFIGSALTRRLVQAGHDVVVLDNNSRGSLERLADIFDDLTFVEADIRDEMAVAKAASGCRAIFHLAFVNGTKFFYEIPEKVLEIGVQGALATINAALNEGVEIYVMASSSEVYQQPENIPTPETERAIIPDVRNPRYSYAGGKLIGELLSQNYFRETAVRDLIFRPHNVFGPNMGSEHVIPELMAKLCVATNHWQSKQVEIEIQGSGEETRAFCYIEDAVDQLLVMYEKGIKGEIYHIGMDSEQTIRQLIHGIGDALEIEISAKAGELRPGGTKRRCPDIRKIQRLGYERTDRFNTGLVETVEWYRKSFEQ